MSTDTMLLTRRNIPCRTHGPPESKPSAIGHPKITMVNLTVYVGRLSWVSSLELGLTSFLIVRTGMIGLFFLSLGNGIVCVGRPNLVFLSPLETMSFLIVPMDLHGLLLFLSLVHGIVCVGRLNLIFLSPLDLTSFLIFLIIPMILHGRQLQFLYLENGGVCVGRRNSVFLSPLETMSFLIVPMDLHGLLLFLSLVHGIVCVGRLNLIFLSPLDLTSFLIFLIIPMILHGRQLRFFYLVHGGVFVGHLNSVFLSPLETMSFLIVPMGQHGLLLFLSLAFGGVCVGRLN